MKLIGSLTSPYVRKARIVLAEKKIEYDFVIESPSSPSSTVADFNPLARIPVLILDDETPVFDSPVIVEYLDNSAPNNKLMPQPNRERMEVKRWEAVADGVLDAAVENRHASLLDPSLQNRANVARNEAVILRSLDFIARELSDKSWCMGTHFGMADVAVGCALGYLDFRFPQIDWRASHPVLHKLFDKLMQRPSFQETVPLAT
ncbi:glutathione S-transferase [Denitratisoma sp. DHT3]|uniref:glutathione S-transferase N-terminal domain-containing protein n=1 Tax=Denitratisoma sp. DHT3 TaxID=1981880 RepID=UPI001198962F|nr:glutathione S-transferase N-terminal domain-containing protein [Denitratisoma sp. DHT3]QDX81231.1 glutathione S-transferase [Denitratisoma sp. DHT3]